ncbi:hypothetical protein CYMTET_56318 [Cymbomonas tetramitiformis]|uniref:25S rRNA (uridine-N(3))-methyltransferase BMT5-like domain-containing protein n=1 Tax=Cymbomonas tetramitiformis TaxID=36881 RepID=A0AAE0BB65_9CHLO|nr:hypothetical protein CYMTET_56318 [Cymbomonas tetramitiformis]
MAKKGRRRDCPRKGGLQQAQHNAKKGGRPSNKSNGINKKKKNNFGSGKKKYTDDKETGSMLPLGYDPLQRILMVGEGNFSFSRALVRLFEGNGFSLLASCFDSEEILHKKYQDAKMIVDEIRSAGAFVKFGVDAKDLMGGTGLAKKKRKEGLSYEDLFDRIVFNFPHCGLGIKDQDKNVLANQQLLEGFFRSAVELLRPEGEIHVTLKSGKPYDMWNIVGSAHRASAKKLVHSTIVSFKPESFPGYSHRRTIGFKEGLDKAENEEIESRSRTYIFVLDK